MARFKKTQSVHPDAPLLHEDHGKPVTRRQFIRQGFAAGGASLLTGGALSLFTNPRDAYAALSNDLGDLVGALPNCTLGGGGLHHLVPEREGFLGLFFVEHVEREAGVDEHVLAHLYLWHIGQAGRVDGAGVIDPAHRQAVLVIDVDDFSRYG